MCFDFKPENRDIKGQGKGENHVKTEFYRSFAHITSTPHFSHKPDKQGVHYEHTLHFPCACF
jgi:hypothetical protein